MKPCPDRHDTIILAAYDELNSEQRQDWEQHKTTCPGCRSEYEAVLRLVGRIRESMPVPELSGQKASAMLWSVKRGLAEERERPSRLKQWLVRPNRLVPALATASIVLITFGLFGPNFSEKAPPPQVVTEVENEAVVKDLEVLTNLDFLEDMDTIQELMNVLDRNQPT